MAGFLQRYDRGEREAVWAELAALGDRVREPETYDDAVAVARETMRRARQNIEILIPRLHELGYAFTYPKPLEPPVRNAAGQLRKLEGVLQGPVPLSLRAWWQEVGRVSILGGHPLLNPKVSGEDVLPDPLDFAPLNYALSSVEDWLDDGGYAAPSLAYPTRDWEAAAKPAGMRFPFDFAPDELHKADISGATYDVMLPDSAADFRLMGAKGDPWFVAYLRRSFSLGGFPGWAGHKNAPMREIGILTKDLLPL